MVPVNIKLINPSAKLPEYQTKGAAGMDCYSPSMDILMAGERKLIKLGFSVEIPEGYEIQVRPRSGLALHHGIMVSNSPGTIDEDYRGEVGVILWNTSPIPYTIQKHERICQFVLQPTHKIDWVESRELNKTDRNEGGFGSTSQYQFDDLSQYSEGK